MENSNALHRFRAKSGSEITIRGLSTSDNRRYLEISHEGRAAIVERGEFATNSTDPIRQALSKKGVQILDNADWLEVTRCAVQTSQFAIGAIITEPGWSDNVFAMLNGSVISADDDPRRTLFTVEERAFGTAGSTTRWKNKVAKPLTGQKIPMAAVMMALAAPLLTIAGYPLNVGFELWGKPATGKTTCQKLAASVAGHPSDILNFNSTMAGFERQFPRHNDMPMIIDEANLANRRPDFLQDLTFDLAHGTRKSTHFELGGKPFRFVFITSANRPFYKSFTESNETANAALQRLFPVEIDRENPLGVFDFLPKGFQSSGAFAAALEDAALINHGLPMRKFLKFVVEQRALDPDKFKRHILALVQEFEERAGTAQTAQGGTRATKAFGLVAAAGILAIEARVLPKQWDCFEAVLACYRNYIRQLPRQAPLEVFLSEILNRAETRLVAPSKLLAITDKQFEKAGAFIRPTRGQIELLVTQNMMDTHIPHWRAIKDTTFYKNLNIKDKDHDNVKRNIRAGKSDRVYCFRFPTDHALVIKFMDSNS